MKEKTANALRVITRPIRGLIDFIFYKLYFSFKNNYDILTPFKNQDLLIVGNGPSLKKTPLSAASLA